MAMGHPLTARYAMTAYVRAMCVRHRWGAEGTCTARHKRYAMSVYTRGRGQRGGVAREGACLLYTSPSPRD
eukprot:537988-Alexandrium_andersonii.AAC.1